MKFCSALRPVVVLIFMFIMVSPANAAVTEYVKYNVGSITDGRSGTSLPVTLSLGLPEKNTAVTYIKYSVRWEGGNADNGSCSVYLAQYVNSNGPQSGGGAEEQLLSTDSFNTKNYNPTPWVTREVAFNPLEGQGVGNYKLIIGPYRESDSTGQWTVRVDEVRYVDYSWDEIKIEITPEKYVKITVARQENVPYSNIRITNNVTGWVNHPNGVKGSYGTYIVTDTSVQPEQYYTYTIESVFGRFATYPLPKTPYTTTVSITVPSDATLARDAAIEAKEYSIAVYDLVSNMDTKMANLETKINNLMANNQTPQIQRISGLGGATCTTTSTFKVLIHASGATHFRAGTSPGSGNIAEVGSPCCVTLTPGINTIYVEAWHENNPTNKAVGEITAFRL